MRLTRLQAIVSLFQALGGGWVLPDEIASDRGRRAARAKEDRQMKLGRILPIAVGLAVVAAVGAYVFMGKQQEQQKQKRARAFQDQAGAGAGRHGSKGRRADLLEGGGPCRPPIQSL